MRIVIFGLTVSSSWGNGHATIWRGLCNALVKQGHSVVFFEKNQPYYANHRDLIEPRGYKLQLYPDWQDILSISYLAVVNSDCAIVTSYCPDAQAASDLVLNCSKGCRVFYDLDTPVTLSVLDRDGTVDYIPAYGLEPFDLVLSYTGGKALDELSRRLAAKRVFPLYGSVDSSIHKRVGEDQRFASDLSHRHLCCRQAVPGTGILFETSEPAFPTEILYCGSAVSAGVSMDEKHLLRAASFPTRASGFLFIFEADA